jgi:hypothetical protein
MVIKLIITMLFFSRPCDQHRLDATVFELVQMRFNGAVCVEGYWDPCCTLEYLERRMGTALLPTLNADGTAFLLRGKYVAFASDCVLVTTVRSDIARFLQT